MANHREISPIANLIDDGRAEILPYKNKGRFYPADWVYVLLPNPDGTVARHGPYMIEMVTGGQYSVCDDDGNPIAIGGKKLFKESEVEAAS
ncbi:hypothetical protein N7517_006239 [Penicillium concentricum]|uniref:Uncharacterized protein n=1 Tax=Penicillium concentricum TaxID=293559 RepID=A0A9W9SDP2_9EURO|nr:uncharacterized protein N7517_006239 [Penicillium concentricum]KAJ5374233.1 hypothetical protein N7517_006239 [Penicillium concentricum]